MSGPTGWQSRLLRFNPAAEAAGTPAINTGRADRTDAGSRGHQDTGPSLTSAAVGSAGRLHRWIDDGLRPGCARCRENTDYQADPGLRAAAAVVVRIGAMRAGCRDASFSWEIMVP